METIPKRNDLGLLYRRQDLSDKHGVLFSPYKPEVPDGAPAYPLRWMATWKYPLGSEHAGDEGKLGPMPMTELIPAVEAKLGIKGK